MKQIHLSKDLFSLNLQIACLSLFIVEKVILGDLRSKSVEKLKKMQI